MCTNQRLIHNRYTGRSLYVKCGSCPACQQEKANKRASRIRSNRTPDKMAWFVHLTYLNECVPYIKLNDLLSRPDRIPVYRDYDRRWSRVNDSKKSRRYLLCYHRQKSPVDYLDLTDDHGVNQLDKFEDIDLTKNLQSLKNTYHRRPTSLPMDGKIGICYYPDVQNFIKKLKENIFRNYGLPRDSFSFYSTSEYGEDGLRPHFHLLIFCDKAVKDKFRSAILKSWSYAFRNITDRRLEIAIDAAKYCSSYVNKPADFPSVLSSPAFKTKHSYSQGFGMALPAFQFDKVMEKVRNGDLRYTRTIYINGSPVQCDVPYPSYVITRYFPKYKGFSRIADSEIHRIGQFSYFNPRGKYASFDVDTLSGSRNALFYGLCTLVFRDHQELNYTTDDVDKIVTSIWNHAYKLNMSVRDYLYAWTAAHRAYKSTLYRSLLDSSDIFHQWQCYDNIEDYYSGDISNESFDKLMFVMPKDYNYESNVNNFYDNVAMTELLNQQFEKYVKTRRLHACLDVNLV